MPSFPYQPKTNVAKRLSKYHKLFEYVKGRTLSKFGVLEKGNEPKVLKNDPVD